jgi:hypothetical protein
MKSSLAGVAAVAAVLSAPAAFAQSVSSAEAGCYVDTSAFDSLSAGGCFGMGSWSGTAVFGVLGLDQTGGRYNVIWLDGTCNYIGYSVQEGSYCRRNISWGTTTQRVQVVDTWTGTVSPILYATAEYESNG